MESSTLHQVIRASVPHFRNLPIKNQCSRKWLGSLRRPLQGFNGLPRLRSRQGIATPVCAAFLGIGAPEAVLVGVVALVLFGPRGLAQAAKSLGATLRAFAPTLRELTAVSTELKSTLEEEIGLNDLRDEFQRPAVPKPRPVRASSDVTEESDRALDDQKLESTSRAVDESLATIIDPDIERKREAAAKLAWEGQMPVAISNTTPGRSDNTSLSSMSVEELEAELMRRKEAGSAKDSGSL